MILPFDVGREERDLEIVGEQSLSASGVNFMAAAVHLDRHRDRDVVAGALERRGERADASGR